MLTGVRWYKDGHCALSSYSKLYHVGIRGQESHLVFPSHEAGSGMLRQEKQGWSLLRKLKYT